jgi:release factor glutamine methyltransferase
MTTIKDAIETMTNQLTPFSTTARLDAELLISYAAGLSRTELFTHPEKQLSASEQKHLQAFLERRMAQEPVAYIVGHKEFWTLDLMVNPDVLIPRPETEMLVEWALTHLPKEKKIQIADLGTGSGAIALALAQACPHWYIDATENSAQALKVAKRNAEKYAIKNVNFYLGEWCQALPRKGYHAILGNPPYIKENDRHLPQLIKSEPRSALVAGADGLKAIRSIIMDARYYLLPGGWLVLEHGYDQREAIINLLQEFGYKNIKDHDDLAKLPRMIVCQT